MEVIIFFIGSGSLGELNTEAQLRIGHADLITISASLTTGDIIFPSTEQQHILQVMEVN